MTCTACGRAICFDVAENGVHAAVSVGGTGEQPVYDLGHTLAEATEKAFASFNAKAKK